MFAHRQSPPGVISRAKPARSRRIVNLRRASSRVQSPLGPAASSIFAGRHLACKARSVPPYRQSPPGVISRAKPARCAAFAASEFGQECLPASKLPASILYKFTPGSKKKQINTIKQLTTVTNCYIVFITKEANPWEL